MGWLNEYICVIKFEDLIGNNITTEIKKIYNVISTRITDEDMDYHIMNIYSSPSPTFRGKGINEWHNFFTLQEKEVINKRLFIIIRTFCYL